MPLSSCLFASDIQI